MFEILLKYIIAEQVIKTLLDNVIQNFNTCKKDCYAYADDIIQCTFTDDDTFRYVSHAMVHKVYEDMYLVSVIQYGFDDDTKKDVFYREYIKIYLNSIIHLEVLP